MRLSKGKGRENKQMAADIPVKRAFSDVISKGNGHENRQLAADVP